MRRLAEDFFFLDSLIIFVFKLRLGENNSPYEITHIELFGNIPYRHAQLMNMLHVATTGNHKHTQLTNRTCAYQNACVFLSNKDENNNFKLRQFERNKKKYFFSFPPRLFLYISIVFE